ncbi:hypothetical protein [Chitinophaga arvensicola]|uniref:Uncharacterized protein n=1 Tax=Chitinophaga arvensicola TaxID=29529 RepID=A0A1I0R772_9BACT|nr:hypothetical protein [Chitinophaga arvensicola]SEW36283.1 hypothetical protein SAMN04488122_2370 [Chitinophaga arvensicola]
MKIIVCALLLFLYPFHSTPPIGNPRYDFADSLIARSGNVYGYLDKRMETLCISGYPEECGIYQDSIYGLRKREMINSAAYEVEDARQYILRKADKYRVILINESHSSPEHRLFTKSLLPALYKKGYQVFMAEGIWPGNQLDKHHYPVSTDGAYLNEPNYGQLIRYAFKTGYQVKSYEYESKPGWDDSIKLDQYGSIKYLSYDPPDSMTVMVKPDGEREFYFTLSREKGQAANIYKVMQANPRSKFIIHVGHGHLYKDGTMMASHLMALLGNEAILCIDQSFFYRDKVIDSQTKAVVDPGGPFVLKNRKNGLYCYAHYSVDAMMFNTTPKDSLYRPGYLFKDVEPRIVYPIPASELESSPCVFTAYYTAELKAQQERAIAVDVICVKDRQQAPPLLLYKGDYTIVKKNRQGVYSTFSTTIR